jgi:3-carboxy-cis,cis-muconate cycloisomerase
MASIVYTSRLFGDLFGTAEMRALFTDEALVARYLAVETALARVQARLGIIPPEAADAIAAAAETPALDWDRLAARTRLIGYPILPLVEQLSEAVPGGLGQWCHYGATTQDVMDTADVLQALDALDLISADLDASAAALAGLAETHAETPMAGRTHMQHALPIPFGLKPAAWLAALDRHRARLTELRPRLAAVQFFGAAGTLASLGEQGPAVREGLAAELGLAAPDLPWHTARDALAEATGLLALIAGSIGKIGLDIILMMQTETGEVLEPFQPGRGGSSTMPQKRNPIASEAMLAAAKIVREQHGAMLDAMIQDHERASGPWMVEWQAVPAAFIAASGGLRAARETLEGLEVRPEAMARGLEVTGGLIVAERVMMGLAPTLGRQVAHDRVYDCCRRALAGETGFLEALCADPEIAAALSREELATLADPARHLGTAPQSIRRYLSRRSQT